MPRLDPGHEHASARCPCGRHQSLAHGSARVRGSDRLGQLAVEEVLLLDVVGVGSDAAVPFEKCTQKLVSVVLDVEVGHAERVARTARGSRRSCSSASSARPRCSRGSSTPPRSVRPGVREVVDRDEVQRAVAARLEQRHQLLHREERVVLLDVLEARDRVDVVEGVVFQGARASRRRARSSARGSVQRCLRVLDHDRRHVEADDLADRVGARASPP